MYMSSTDAKNHLISDVRDVALAGLERSSQASVHKVCEAEKSAGDAVQLEPGAQVLREVVPEIWEDHAPTQQRRGEKILPPPQQRRGKREDCYCSSLRMEGKN